MLIKQKLRTTLFQFQFQFQVLQLPRAGGRRPGLGRGLGPEGGLQRGVLRAAAGRLPCTLVLRAYGPARGCSGAFGANA